MDNTEERRLRIKALITGKKLKSILSIIDRQVDDTGKENPILLDKTSFYDTNQIGDIQIEIIYKQKQIQDEKF